MLIENWVLIFNRTKETKRNFGMNQNSYGWHLQLKFIHWRHQTKKFQFINVNRNGFWGQLLIVNTGTGSGSKTVPSSTGTSDGSIVKAPLHFVLSSLFLAWCGSAVTKFWVQKGGFGNCTFKFSRMICGQLYHWLWLPVKDDSCRAWSYYLFGFLNEEWKPYWSVQGKMSKTIVNSPTPPFLLL